MSDFLPLHGAPPPAGLDPPGAHCDDSLITHVLPQLGLQGRHACLQLGTWLASLYDTLGRTSHGSLRNLSRTAPQLATSTGASLAAPARYAPAGAPKVTTWTVWRLRFGLVARFTSTSVP